jgi:O-antigen/teichoic acid export membrane protein
MTEIQLIPDSPGREVDGTISPDAGLEPGAADSGRAPLNEVSRRFGRNVIVTILARLVNMARGVLVVPFLLAHIGLEAYGIWTAIFILVSYVGVTTLGLSNVYIKYVAEFHARREYERANSLLSTGLAVTIPLCGAIYLGFLLGWKWYAPWLHLPPAHAADGKEAVLIVLGVFLSSIAFNAFGDMLAGLQQIATTQVFQMISILIEFILILWLVSIGRGIAGLAEAYLARVLINDGLTIWWACSRLEWLHLSVRKIRRESIQYVVHFGGMVQLQTMFSIFLSSAERVMALWLIDASAAGLLDVAKKWPAALSTVPSAFYNALLPAASHVDAASGNTDRLRNLRELYLSVSRSSNLFTGATLAVIAFWAQPILHVWLGPKIVMMETLLPLFVIFSLAMHLHILTGPGTSIFRGIGRVYDEYTYTIPNLLLLAVALPAAYWIQGRWTPLGIGLATSAATAISACVLMGWAHRYLKLPLMSFLRSVIVPGMTPYLVAGLLAWPTVRLVAAVSRWQGAGVLFVMGVIYMVAVLAILHRWVLTDDENAKVVWWIRRSMEILHVRAAAA